MPPTFQAYLSNLSETDRTICDFLFEILNRELPMAESKIWHRHPVWFIQGNPIVGFSKQKKGIRLMFWSGADFEEEALNVQGNKFKDASIFYTDICEIDPSELTHWLQKAIIIQWDYKNIVKRKGKLERIIT
ncbi:MAG: hypothetical protein RL737_1031 [Bacteroidota bacterium]|jgi:uncharacterized protein YdhG (YjbR/CyaY superfamily)